MRPKRIVLDLDDVLNTLSLDLLKLDGVDFKRYEDIPEWTWGYDIIQAMADLTMTNPMTVQGYWEGIPRELWSDTRLAPDFDAIIEFCDDKVGLENVMIGTSPTKCHQCVAGKYEWMMKHLPKELHRQWAITPRKWELGRDPETLLIDDLEDNCSKFRETGGQAIVVPRPWNSWAHVPVMDAIKVQWEEICEDSPTS